jgi:hypothetical protein
VKDLELRVKIHILAASVLREVVANNVVHA